MTITTLDPVIPRDDDYIAEGASKIREIKQVLTDTFPGIDSNLTSNVSSDWLNKTSNVVVNNAAGDELSIQPLGVGDDSLKTTFENDGTLTLATSGVNGNQAVDKDYTDNAFISKVGDSIVNSDTKWADGQEAQFGDDSDLSISHNGTDSSVENLTGSLKVKSNLNSTLTDAITVTSGTEVEVSLSHDGSTKLSTKTDGVSINGEVSATRLEVSDDTDTYMDNTGVYDDGERVYSGNNKPSASDLNFTPRTSSTGASQLPSGNASARPSPSDGMIRSNTDKGRLESYIGGSWRDLATVEDLTERTDTAASSVADMKAGIFGGEDISSSLSNIMNTRDILVKTFSYYEGWAALSKPKGGATYIGTTLQKVRDTLSSPTWLPDGNINHQAFGGSTYVWMLQHQDHILATQAGCKGDGVSDDLPFIQNALDYIHDELGEGVLRFTSSDTYKITSYIVLRPKVSLEGEDGPHSLIKSTTIIGGGLGDIFLPGNFHPDFTEDFTYYPANSFTDKTRELTITGNGGNFEVGDQVFISSNVKGTSGGFAVPAYAWLNVVTGVSGDVVTFQYAIDHVIDVGVAVLKNETCRNGRSAFFYQDASIKNLKIECDGNWISDSASLNVKFENLEVTANTAVYGNTFQHAQWADCLFNWRSAISEQSHNSLHTLCHGCTFNYIGVPGTSSHAGISIQEFARDIVYSDYKITGNYASGNPVLRTINAQDVKFIKGQIDIEGTGGISVIQLGLSTGSTNSLPEFASDGNEVDNLVLRANNVGRYALLTTGEHSKNNGIKNSKFYGSSSVNENVRFQGDTPCSEGSAYFDGCWTEDGRIATTGDLEYSYSVKNTHTENGFINETGVTTDFIERGSFSGNSSANSIKRKGFCKYKFLTFVPQGNVTLDTFPLGDTTSFYDRYEVVGELRSQGNSDNRVVNIYLNNITDTSEVLIGSFTGLAAEALVTFGLSIEFVPQGSAAACIMKWANGSTGDVTSDTYYTSSFSTIKEYEIRVESSVPTGGNASWQLLKLAGDILSPLYAY